MVMSVPNFTFRTGAASRGMRVDRVCSEKKLTGEDAIELEFLVHICILLLHISGSIDSVRSHVVGYAYAQRRMGGDGDYKGIERYLR